MAEIFKTLAIGDAWMSLVIFVTPLWIATMVGILVGWVWKPSCADLVKQSFDVFASKGCLLLTTHSSLVQSTECCRSDEAVERRVSEALPPPQATESCGGRRAAAKPRIQKLTVVTEEDLKHLCLLVDGKDGGPIWKHMMDRCAANMEYQAWRRDPENRVGGPTQYRTRSVFENATPEMVRDFFWDDSFRSHWDEMLIHSEILDEDPVVGTITVHWIRKFPFFCSDREYIIGRRIWDLGRSYYCITKAVPCDLPRRSRPRRVDVFYSSWCIRAVESKKVSGQYSACEVLLFHHEDMGIPSEIAKLGVRQGMWGAVKKIEPGLRLYQRERKCGMPLSRCAFVAQINTKLGEDYMKSLENCVEDDSRMLDSSAEVVVKKTPNIPKLLILCGAVFLACTLDRRLVSKAAMFGASRRFAGKGTKL